MKNLCLCTWKICKISYSDAMFHGKIDHDQWTSDHIKAVPKFENDGMLAVEKEKLLIVKDFWSSPLTCGSYQFFLKPENFTQAKLLSAMGILHAPTTPLTVIGWRFLHTIVNLPSVLLIRKYHEPVHFEQRKNFDGLSGHRMDLTIKWNPLSRK